MIEIEKPRIDTVEMTADGTYGKFVMEPLERGYATTLGNSMRRVLLSILPMSFQLFPVLKRMLLKLSSTSRDLLQNFMPIRQRKFILRLRDLVLLPLLQ